MADMGTALQENVLTLMCFSTEHVSTIVENVTPQTFDNEIYANIAKAAAKYFRKYGRPVSEHLPDVLDRHLRKGREEARDYRAVVRALIDYKDRIHSRYVMEELELFIRSQEFKKRVKKAIELYQAEKLDAAELELKKVESSRVSTFDPGIVFGRDMRKTLAFLHNDEDHLYITGIGPLDELGISPARGELFVIVALPGHGKSWAMIHITKMNLLTRCSVAYVSLEMSQDKISMRTVQSMFGVSKNSTEVRNTRLAISDEGVVTGLAIRNLNSIKSFKDDGIEAFLTDRLQNVRRIQNLYIKQFPTGQLSVDMLRAYLDNLATFHGQLPDILVVDYADLMQLDAAHLRVDTGRVYKELRGIAVEYDIAVVTASQANRAGEGTRVLTRKNLAEDFSKVAIADNVITYNQSPIELERGLARLYVDKARNDRRGDMILLTQNYTIGQFCLQAARLNRVDNYDELVGSAEPTGNNGEHNVARRRRRRDNDS